MLPFKEIDNKELTPYLEVSDLEFAIKNGVLYTEVDGEVVIAISKEDPDQSLNYISHNSDRFNIVLLTEESYSELLSKFKEITSSKTMEDFSSSEDDESDSLDDFLKNDDDLLSSENSAPIIQFVNTLFMKAVKQNCTDIHIETYEKDGLVKFRIDGFLLK